ncbi:MAG: molybdopterin-dependent oxidoreductase [Hyphomicrobiaceae bacterium]
MAALHSSHWGAFEAVIEDGMVTDVRPFMHDAKPSPILKSIPEAVHHPIRVVRPSIREGWLEHRDQNRGADRFIEFDWDDALDLVAKELGRVRNSHGNEAIFAGSYGWSSAGRFHHAKTQLQRFMNCIGGYTGQKHSYSLAAGLAILPYIVGDHRPLRCLTTWDSIVDATELFVAFGGVGARNAQVEPGGMGSHTTETWLRAMADKGIQIVSITPLRNDTPTYLRPDWWALRPNTDVALMLGLAHTLVTEDLHNCEFLATHTVGFDNFSRYLLGETDGQPKSASWAGEICGLDPKRIIALSRAMAASRTMIATSYSLQRGDHGEQTFWMTMTLAAILGQIGLPGGGFGFGYGSMHGQGNPVGLPLPISHGTGDNPTDSFIPVARIADLLLKPGSEYDFDGQRRRYPQTKIIYWCGGNPFHHHQDLNRLLEGWRRPDTVVVNEQYWTPTAKLADIVLPATTTLERNDIGASSRDRYVIAMKQAVRPQGEARNDYDIFRALALRMGCDKSFTLGRDEMGWLRALYDSACEKASNSDTNFPDFDTFWDCGFIETEYPATCHNIYEDFRANPEQYALTTPSGRLEIYSEQIAGFGYEDCPGHPVWLEPAEWLGGATAQKWPLHLVSNQPVTRLHSQLDFAGISRAAKVSGREVVRLSQSEASKRGICEGDVVRIYNDRGETLASAAISNELREGVALLPTGAWFDPASTVGESRREKHGNPNVLTLDKGTSRLGQGPIAHTALVEIEKFDERPPAVTAFELPDIVSYHRKA